MKPSSTRWLLTAALLCGMWAPIAAGGANYRNFNVAVYCRVYEVRQMKDPAYLESAWAAISPHVKIDKVYLETHRDTVVVDQATLDQAKRFFEGKGVKVAGGITATINESNQFETYCYSNPEHRRKLQEVVEFTARNFDEIILDDFFFTSCKCDLCIKAKGNRSWTAFRLALMDEAGRNLILKPARAVNPRVRVTIKYPNWYEHFQSLGFNLETEPTYFDKIYTGTETRDGVYSNQHLQPYHGYSIFRYFENIKPGGNAGGWVDTGGLRNLDRYAEQLWLTLFAKAPEITLFDIRQLYQPIRQQDASLVPESEYARLAGYVFQQVDAFAGRLGNPIGVKTYKPYHSSGEDHLASYLGMIGIPMDIVPVFPAEAQTVLLTEAARYDPSIVDRIRRQLQDGKTVVITSGLLKALQGHGIEDIVELEYTGRTVAAREFFGRGVTGRSETDILLPEIRYATNDSWEVVSALTSPSRTTGTPILHSAKYSKGLLYVLTIPQAQGDLYSFPPDVLTAIRTVVCRDLYVRVEAPAQVSLFVYDNDTFIVESFRETSGTARIVTDKRIAKLRDLLTGRELAGQPRGDKMVFDTFVRPGSYSVFSAATVLAGAGPSRTIATAALEDKIRGGWAGKMIGVSYGAPTEFRSNGRIFEGEITWSPERVSNALGQDDLYVGMTMAETMDRLGFDATVEQYGEAFKGSQYDLWHANAGARRLLNLGVKAPMSGHPEYNIHANDIDFQIEADFIGLMSPGLPRESNKYCLRVGRVMNDGDGLYGGMFVSGMYTAAFFETDARAVVAQGLACLPPGSRYARVIRDVLDWSARYPGDWKKTWQLVEDTWDRDDSCPDGALRPFNIDATINGAYIALGLLYGRGDFARTIEIAARSGQDSDCNPSTAGGILGVMLGYSSIPDVWKSGIPALADRKFEYTQSSLNDICRSTLNRALKLVRLAGGSVTGEDVTVSVQAPAAAALVQWDMGIPDRRVGVDDPAWQFKGFGRSGPQMAGGRGLSMRAGTAGAEAVLTFTGAGLAVVGDMTQEGGRADVFLDGRAMRAIDAYASARTHDNDLWHAYGLPQREHTLKIVTRGDADPRSTGRTIAVVEAVVYRAR